MQYRIKPTWLHPRWAAEVGFPIVEEFLFSVPPSADQLFCLLSYIQSIPWAPCPRIKLPGCKAQHWLLSHAEANSAWCCTYIPHTHVHTWCSRTYFDDYHLLGDDNHHSHRRGNLRSYKEHILFALSYTASGLCAVGLLHGINIVPTSNTGIILTMLRREQEF
jgi:hypothetical protein